MGMMNVMQECSKSFGQLSVYTFSLVCVYFFFLSIFEVKDDTERKRV